MIAKYLGRPLMGISPNPKVVKVLMDSITALRILMLRSYRTAIRNAPTRSNPFSFLFPLGNSLQVPFIISILLKKEAESLVLEIAHL